MPTSKPNATARRGALALASMGSFHVGGRVVHGPPVPAAAAEATRPGLGNESQTFIVDSMYVQVMVPTNPRPTPVVLVHGGGQTGQCWESTPDGREGLRTLLLRRGFTTYVVDMPRRGRSGLPSFNGPFGMLGDTPICAAETRRMGARAAFETFRFGTWPDGGEPEWFPGSRAPKGSAALAQLARQTSAFVELDAEVVTQALGALLAEIGPASLVTHSQSGLFGWLVGGEHSALVRSIVAFEPVQFVVSDDQTAEIRPGSRPPRRMSATAFGRLATVPLRCVYGDRLEAVPFTHAAFEDCQQFVGRICDAGGRAECLHLPDVGVYGNTHFPFFDENNDLIADLVAELLADG